MNALSPFRHLAALAHDERSKTVQAYRRSDLLGPLMEAWAKFLVG